ncbi:hypothetical protein Sjap_015800 [Stephania japonica]|uniref:Uncharacterized protein n=1 Tax=Stephania japonica TaxID=461633 RepID=A0AAP0IKX3_9MAGN
MDWIASQSAGRTRSTRGTFQQLSDPSSNRPSKEKIDDYLSQWLDPAADIVSLLDVLCNYYLCL